MIVPSRQLLTCAVVALPLGGLLLPMGGAMGVAGALLWLALIVLAGVDAVMSARWRNLVKVTAPSVVRLVAGREGEFIVKVKSKSARPRIRLAMNFPGAVRALLETLEVDLPGKGVEAAAPWPCQGDRRGQWKVTEARFELRSFLGMWLVRGRSSTPMEIRVYPNMIKEHRALLSFSKNAALFGAHPRRQLGKGREFDKLREYASGDSYDDVHWKATARRGSPIVKVHRIERTQEIYAFIDCSRLTGRLAGSEPMLEKLIKAGLALGLASERMGDMFGVGAFSDRVGRFVRAGMGRGHYGACREALYNLEYRPVTPDYGELVVFIRSRLRRRSLVILLVALDDPVIAESFVTALPMLAREHVVLAGVLKPPEARPLFENEEITGTEDIYQELAGHLAWRRLMDVRQLVRRHGGQMLVLDQEHLIIQLVSEYMNIKQRQLL